ncbi:MAG: B12-binding domain-containing radical SAM protein, partial [Anaerovoracaceae bacterium]
MKFLLTAVNAKYIHPNPALYLLKKCAEREGTADIRIREFTINEYPEEILGEIYREDPDFIGISCYIWNWKTVKWIVSEIDKVMPDVSVWLGGPEVSYNAEDVLAVFDGVDGVFTGEGEISFSEFVSLAEKNGRSFFSDKNLLEKVPGIVYRDGSGGYVHTPERRPEDLDELPFIYDDLAEFSNRIVYYETSRGCPYRCAYCVSSIENGIRLRSLGLVEKELQFFLDS